MRGRVRREPPQRLLALALGRDGLAAARLVGRDDDVDEPLEEVALLRVRRPPRRLERLVGVEARAAAAELEPALVLAQDGAIVARRYGHVLLCGVDLFIRGKLEALLPEHRFETTDGIDPPDLVIADIARVDAEDVADSYPDVPLLGYTNHTDTAGLRRAHTAGFDQVIAKSALFERTREVIDRLLASVE